MTYIEFKEKCNRIFKINNLPLPTDEQSEKLFSLTERMLQVNKSINLTAITDIDGVILRHYADSLTVSEHIPTGSHIIDIGCGAGFPTLPLAIFRPDLQILALDSTAKRIDYVQKTAELLELDGVSSVAARAEELAQQPEYRESFDLATARAVASLPVLSELCLPFVRVGGSFVAMKASKGEQELAAAQNAIALCGGKLEKTLNIELSNGTEQAEPRSIIKILKASSTPQKYPRHYSQISKKPL